MTYKYMKSCSMSNIIYELPRHYFSNLSSWQIKTSDDTQYLYGYEKNIGSNINWCNFFGGAI